MLTDSNVKNFIKELEAEMVTCQEEDQFGYAKIDAYDVYKKVIKRLKEKNKGGYLDVEEYYKE